MDPSSKAVVDRRRHDRLRSLLPEVYATEPGSVLGALVDLLGDLFRDIDRDLERAMRDRWVLSAAAERSWGARARVPEGWRARPHFRGEHEVRARVWGELLGLDPREVFGGPSATLAIYDSPVLVPAKRANTQLGQLRALLAQFVDDPQAEDGRPDPRPEQAWVELRLRTDVERILVDSLVVAWVPVAGGSTLFICGPAPEPKSAEGDALDRLLHGLEGVCAPGDVGPRTVDLETPLPLELLGAALDLRRLPWESDAQTYRQRLRILAPLLVEGLGTPRAILSATLTSLHAEPCPRLEHIGDTTTAQGLRPGALNRCRACRGGRRREGDPAECPQRAQVTMSASLIDNPHTRVKISRAKLQPGAVVALTNESLFSTRPDLRLRITSLDGAERAIVALRSNTTSEQLILPHPLAPGEVLHLRSLQPQVDTDDGARHLQEWVDLPGSSPPEGAAWIEGGAVLDNIVFARGPRFDVARFGSAISEEGPRFTVATLSVQTPELVPGANEWVLELLGGERLAAIATELGEDYREQLTAELEQVEGLAAPEAAELELSIEWWTRPPGRFALRIPATAAVQAVRARGADVHLRRMIDRVRPCGVFATLDFPSTPLRDSLEPGDALVSITVEAREALEPGDGASGAPSTLALELREEIAPEDVGGWQGVFDATRLDFSRAQGSHPEPDADTEHE